MHEILCFVFIIGTVRPVDFWEDQNNSNTLMATEGAYIGRLNDTFKIPVNRPVDRKLKGKFPDSGDFTAGRPIFTETMGSLQLVNHPVDW